MNITIDVIETQGFQREGTDVRPGRLSRNSINCRFELEASGYGHNIYVSKGLFSSCVLRKAWPEGWGADTTKGRGQ